MATLKIKDVKVVSVVPLPDGMMEVTIDTSYEIDSIEDAIAIINGYKKPEVMQSENIKPLPRSNW